MNNNFLLQALQFFDQEFRPKTCTCGIVVAFNTKMALQCVRDVFGAEVAQDITRSYTIIHQIKRYRLHWQTGEVSNAVSWATTSCCSRQKTMV